MSFAEFFTEHDILINTSLYLFIEIGIIEAQSQSVRPFFSNHTDFSNHSFIMVLVIEAFQMVNLTFVEWRKTHTSIFSDFKVTYIRIYIIIIIRKVLKSVHFIHKTILEYLSETYV